MIRSLFIGIVAAFIGIFLFSSSIVLFTSPYSLRDFVYPQRYVRCMQDHGLSQKPEAEVTTQAYNVSIDIEPDTSMRVTEEITVDYKQPRHGIYRFVPLIYEPAGEGFDARRFSLIHIDEIHVLHNGSPAVFTKMTQRSEKCVQSYLAELLNEELFLGIGDPGTMMNGIHKYTISYQVHNALRYERDTSELYWNFIPHQWRIPIQKSSVKLTSRLPIQNVACYIGPVGSTDQSCRVHKEGVRTYLFESSEHRAFEGITLLVQFDTKTTFFSYFGNIGAILQNIAHHPFELFAMIPLLYGLVLRFRARSRASRGIIVPRFEPPPGVSPAQAGLLLDQNVDGSDFSAMIISLATKGKISITPVRRGLFGWKQDHIVTRISDGLNGPISPEEHSMLNLLFTNGSSKVYLSLLSKRSYEQMYEIKRVLFQWAVQKGYFRCEPTSENIPINPWVALSVLAPFIALVVHVGLFFWFLYAISLLMGLITFIRYPFYTPLGISLKEEILGFKLYLSTAEKDRLVFHNTPEKTPELFERYLPYAISLGVVDIWTKQFEKIYTTKPQWFESQSTTSFDLAAFSRDIPLRIRLSAGHSRSFTVGGSSYSTNYSYSSSRKKSYSSGNSESNKSSGDNSGQSGGNNTSGGGFSGGGGGGGGGGSW